MKTKIKPDERVQHVMVNQEMLHLLLRDGRHLIVPLDWFPRLQEATAAQREKWEILGAGFVIRWPEIDEDIEVSGLLAGHAAPERRDSVSIEPTQIREYRRRANLSQSELADQLGVRQATVSDWEKNKSDPSPLATSRLMDAMRKLELTAESGVENMSYPAVPMGMSFGPETSLLYLDADAQRFLAKCRFLDAGAGGAMIVLNDCIFPDLPNSANLGFVGPKAPPRFNPINRLAQSCTLSPK